LLILPLIVFARMPLPPLPAATPPPFAAIAAARAGARSKCFRDAIIDYCR